MGLIVPTAMHPEREDQPMPYDWFVGIDWGSQQHQVCVLDRDRRRVGERAVDHDGASLAQLADWLMDRVGGPTAAGRRGHRSATGRDCRRAARTRLPRLCD